MSCVRRRRTVAPSRAATTTSTREAAIWKGTNRPRTVPVPSRVCRFAVRNEASMLMRLARQAGTTPKSRAHSTATAAVSASTVRSGRAESEISACRLPSACSRSGPASQASATPRAAPGIASSRLSTSSWRTKRVRGAPSAPRMANSCRRPAARARKSPERLAEQMRSTAPTRSCSKSSGRRYSSRSGVQPVRAEFSWMRTFSTQGRCRAGGGRPASSTRGRKASISARASGKVLPGLSLTKVVSHGRPGPCRPSSPLSAASNSSGK